MLMTLNNHKNIQKIENGFETEENLGLVCDKHCTFRGRAGLSSKLINVKRDSVWISRGAENMGIHPRSAAGIEVKADLGCMRQGVCPGPFTCEAAESFWASSSA